MKYHTIIGACNLLLFSMISCNEPQLRDSQSIVKPIEVDYVKTMKEDTVDNYFGTKISDPYRWLEDANSENTKKWVADQNKTTFGYLENIPFRDKLKERLKKIWNYERFSSPFKEGAYYYFYRNSGLQNQSVLYRQKSLDGTPEIVIDPNTFSEDGTSSIAGTGFSKDARYMAYGRSDSGSDWRTIKVLDLKTLKTLEDEVKWVKFSGTSWWNDGFFYSRYDAPKKGADAYSQKNEYHKVYYHKLGDPQSKDELIYQDKKHPQRNFNCGVSDDQRFLFFYASEGTSGNSLSFKDLKAGDKEFTSIYSEFKSDFWSVNNVGDDLFVMTNYKAPNFRLLKINAKNPSEKNWVDLIPESENTLRSVSMIGGKFVANYIVDAASEIRIYGQDGKLERNLNLPGIGTVGGFNGKKDEEQCFYNYTSYNQPNTIYSYNINTNKSNVFKAPQVDFDPEKFETKRVFYNGKDGTKIPLYITYKKGLKLDGNNPTWLYGYGGFNISIQPRFSTKNIIWLENGGVYAVANIRGGGEYGEKWHKAGTLLNKQNVFDDFITAAEYLIDKKYTNSNKLAIEGRSNGGLLVGACMTQRPDLFKVALPAVGVLDMMRYHKFTIGWAWAGDYGRSDDSTQYKNLLSYSPLHNVKPGTAYPATMVTTSDHDDRVVPAHSFKFISEVQDKHKGENPVLIRIETSAGHGAGRSTESTITEIADIISFTLYNMGESFQVKQ